MEAETSIHQFQCERRDIALFLISLLSKFVGAQNPHNDRALGTSIVVVTA